MPVNNQPSDERKPQPWRRHALTGAVVVGVVVTATAYPPAAVPLGLGLAALQLAVQLLRRNRRDE